MPATTKVLADGQLPSAKGTLYTAPAGGAILKYYSIYNTSAVTQTIKLYVNASGTSREIDRAVLALNERGEGNITISLESGDTIEGETTTASVVNYIITGATT